VPHVSEKCFDKSLDFFDHPQLHSSRGTTMFRGKH
jgi:hypothetical protein